MPSLNNKQQINSLPSLLLDEIFKKSQDLDKNSVLLEINTKLDNLIAMLNPPRSAIITGPEVERVIKELNKAKGG